MAIEGQKNRSKRNSSMYAGNFIAWSRTQDIVLTGAKCIPTFFYFSGHGSPVVGTDKTTIDDGLLVPYAATLDNLDDRTAISLAYLKSELGKIKNKSVVILIDACFSGSGKSVSGMKLIKPQVNQKLLSSNKLFISAAAADRPAEEYVPGQQGAFTYFFSESFDG